MKFMQLFYILNINFKKIFFIAIFSVGFYEFFIKLRCIFNPLKITLKVTSETLLIDIN